MSNYKPNLNSNTGNPTTGQKATLPNETMLKNNHICAPVNSFRTFSLLWNNASFQACLFPSQSLPTISRVSYCIWQSAGWVIVSDNQQGELLYLTISRVSYCIWQSAGWVTVFDNQQGELLYLTISRVSYCIWQSAGWVIVFDNQQGELLYLTISRVSYCTCQSAGWAIVSVSYTHLTLPTIDDV